jgi:hypothetical protein
MANKKFALSEATFVIGAGPSCCGSHGVCLFTDPKQVLLLAQGRKIREGM